MEHENPQRRGYHKTSEHSSDSRHEWVESTHPLRVRVQLQRGGCCVGESINVLHPLYLVRTYQQAHFVLGEDSSEQEMAKITICGKNKDPQGDLSPHPERMEHTEQATTAASQRLAGSPAPDLASQGRVGAFDMKEPMREARLSLGLQLGTEGVKG